MLVPFQNVKAEGSGTWGTDSNRRSWLWVPANSNTSNTGYGVRGFIMLPSVISGSGSSTYNGRYNPDHRLYVFVKDGETVFWGFRRNGGSGNIRVKWFYDQTDTGLFPTGVTGTGRTQISSFDYNPSGTGSASGRPASAVEAANGPSALGSETGYSARSFTNDTGADRAFWVEITTTSNGIISSGFNIDFWDITVASGSSGNYSAQPGRVYSKLWSIVNGLPSTAGSVDNNLAFHDDFGFYVPVDNTFSTSPNDYFVKYANFGRSHGGYVNFFANQDGPRNDLDYLQNRKSIIGTSSNYQYPLFLNNPDESIWTTTEPPTASLEINYQEKPAPGTGGEAYVDLTISLPAIVDVLVDLNSNGVYDEGIDLVISENYDTPGTFQIYWNGEDAAGNELPNGADIEFFAAVLFFPVHFPVYDMEQSLGITVSNVRPGAVVENAIYWDDSNIPRTGNNGISLATSAQSLAVNVTGEAGSSHIWWASGDNGISQNNTMNTWAASYYTEVSEREGFNFLTISGNVFDDINALADDEVNGTPTSAGPIYAVLVNTATNTIRRVVQVAADGSYSLRKIANGSYKIIITTAPVAIGEPEPSVILPTFWENTGENIGLGIGHDGDINGVIDGITISGSSLTEVNFGLRPIISDLVVTKVVDEESPEYNSLVTFTITASNEGYSTAENVEVLESMPNGYTYISHTVDHGTYNSATKVWEIGTLPTGVIYTLQITARVEENNGDYRNEVLIIGTTPDSNPDNNTDAAATIPFRILPVNWLYLKGKETSEHILIEWATAQEKNNDHFIVQRSRNGKNWTDLSQIAAIGNSTEVSIYTSTDSRPMKGDNYYRIKQVDFDGKISYSEVLRIRFETEASIIAYPNPFIDQVFIEMENIRDMNIEILNDKGELIHPNLLESSLSHIGLDFSKLLKGIYLIKLSDSQSVFTKRIIKTN